MKTDLPGWDEAFENSLKAVLDEGLSVEQALVRYPDQATALRPELKAVAWMHQQRQVLSARGWEVSQSRRRLENRLLLQRPNWPAYWRRLSMLRFGFQAVVIFVFLVTLAQFNMKVAYASASSIPGDPFYPLKLAKEQAQLALTFSHENEARVWLEIARQRSSELESLVLEGRYDDIGLVAEQVANSFERVKQQIEKVSEDQESQALVQELNRTLEIQQAVLSALAGMVPPEARDQLLPLLEP